MNLSGPYVHANLAVFLIHEAVTCEHEELLTLQEALVEKSLTVDETGEVNVLSASNAGELGVYLQSGDIVKGGQQDRVLQYDVVMPPRTAKVALDVFCVEAGRWEARGAESVQGFSVSTESLMTKQQKLAVKVAGNQREVWDSVAAAQQTVSQRLGHSVISGLSQSSLQLSLEDERLSASIEDSVSIIERQFPNRGDTVGCAISVNGTVDSVDIFASPRLFDKMKGKLLRAAAAQAIAELGSETSGPPTAQSVLALIEDAESGTIHSETQILGTRIVRKETSSSIAFITDDARIPQQSLHRNYLAK